MKMKTGRRAKRDDLQGDSGIGQVFSDAGRREGRAGLYALFHQHASERGRFQAGLSGLHGWDTGKNSPAGFRSLDAVRKRPRFRA